MCQAQTLHKHVDGLLAKLGPNSLFAFLFDTCRNRLSYAAVSNDKIIYRLHSFWLHWTNIPSWWLQSWNVCFLPASPAFEIWWCRWIAFYLSRTTHNSETLLRLISSLLSSCFCVHFCHASIWTNGLLALRRCTSQLCGLGLLVRLRAWLLMFADSQSQMLTDEKK